MNEGVPKGWSQTRLGEVVNLFNGKAGGVGGSWLRVFKTRHVYDGYVRLSNPAFAPDERASSIPKGTYLCGGDTLTPNMAHGTIGRIAFVREAAESWTVDGQIMVLRPKGRGVIGRYVYDWMSRPESKRLLVKMEKGGAFDELRGQTHIYRNDVASIQILLPPVPEQRKIAEILSSIDDTIEATQAVIGQLQVVKKAMMDELLTRGLPGRHTRFKQTETADIPEDWEIVRLADIAIFVTSGSRGWAQYYADDGALFVRITNLVRGSTRLDLAEQQRVRLPPGSAEGTRTRVLAGDVLVSITADLGIVALVPPNGFEEAYVNQHIALVRLDAARAFPAYVAAFLAGYEGQRQFLRLNDAGAKAGLNLTNVRSLVIPLPPMDEQIALGADTALHQYCRLNSADSAV